MVEGSLSASTVYASAGLLWVTGRLTMSGSASWNGIIMVVGEGEFVRTGGGSGDTVYCNADVLGASPITRYSVVEFRQM